MILGLDFDTRAVHAVLLDDDSNDARYVPIPFSDRSPKEAFRVEDARAIRSALLATTFSDTKRTGVNFWESLWLCGIEKPYAQGRGTAYTYGLVTGAILACIPAGVCVVMTSPQEWKAETVGKASASKDEVRAWGLGVDSDGNCTGCGKHCGTIDPACPVCRVALDRLGWPQDGFDALAIAVAARSLNARGIAAA